MEDCIGRQGVQQNVVLEKKESGTITNILCWVSFSVQVFLVMILYCLQPLVLLFVSKSFWHLYLSIVKLRWIFLPCQPWTVLFLCPVDCYASLSNVPPFVPLQAPSHLVHLFLIVIIFNRKNHFIMGAVGQYGSREEGNCELCHHPHPRENFQCCQYFSLCVCVCVCVCVKMVVVSEMEMKFLPFMEPVGSFTICMKPCHWTCPTSTN